MGPEHITAIGASIAAILTAAGGMFLGLKNRGDKEDEDAIKRLTTELKHERTMREFERQSGQRWYELALWWHAKAHEMRGEVAGAQQSAISAARIAKFELQPFTTNLDLPRLEDPIPPLPKPN
ncbi:hypothetical protein [Teichococcus oryzae]|uniref:Uncharacterized protein n=1 Tax=Teichococcus oryzae TaxID=1608942 RepID=A0A5B2TB57_9PROT|nr:hypothetical protein [Pseudoroseomonas oryzae]KAA2211314.1 hypothetical protein F0Q34_20710 [Pseudoroseomonas oryzae]